MAETRKQKILKLIAKHIEEKKLDEEQVLKFLYEIHAEASKNYLQSK